MSTSYTYRHCGLGRLPEGWAGFADCGLLVVGRRIVRLPVKGGVTCENGLAVVVFAKWAAVPCNRRLLGAAVSGDGD